MLRSSTQGCHNEYDSFLHISFLPHCDLRAGTTSLSFLYLQDLERGSSSINIHQMNACTKASSDDFHKKMSGEIWKKKGEEKEGRGGQIMII